MRVAIRSYQKTKSISKYLKQRELETRCFSRWWRKSWEADQGRQRAREIQQVPEHPQWACWAGVQPEVEQRGRSLAWRTHFSGRRVGENARLLTSSPLQCLAGVFHYPNPVRQQLPGSLGTAAGKGQPPSDAEEHRRAERDLRPQWELFLGFQICIFAGITLFFQSGGRGRLSSLFYSKCCVNRYHLLGGSFGYDSQRLHCTEPLSQQIHL